MKRLLLCLLLLVVCITQRAVAMGVIHIADGDCTSLSAAAATPAGQPLIILARGGHYDGCSLQVTGDVTIDGAGAQMPLIEYRSNDGTHTSNQITVGTGATLNVRNLNFRDSVSTGAAKTGATQPKFLATYFAAISNSGTLVLDSVSIFGESFGRNGIESIGGGSIGNSGNLILRNTTIANNANVDDAFPFLQGNVEISHSTIANNSVGRVFGGGTVSIANSIIVNTSGPICSGADFPTQFTSRGGNIVGDSSCQFSSANDHVVADAHFLDFGPHGGVADTLALDYDSPAVRNGFAANCEAADARGKARGQNGCDAGAYEVGGGQGKLSESGISGLYFNSANNGHYVLVQRLPGGDALVMWNTFDEKGAFAWMYGVGTVTGTKIHIAQMAQNIGGLLHQGGAVTGATPTLWGTLDLNFSDCHSATLNYQSALPLFGSGSINLQRLVYVDGLDCSQ